MPRRGNGPHIDGMFDFLNGNERYYNSLHLREQGHRRQNMYYGRCR